MLQMLSSNHQKILYFNGRDILWKSAMLPKPEIQGEKIGEYQLWDNDQQSRDSIWLPLPKPNSIPIPSHLHHANYNLEPLIIQKTNSKLNLLMIAWSHLTQESNVDKDLSLTSIMDDNQNLNEELIVYNWRRKTEREVGHSTHLMIKNLDLHQFAPKITPTRKFLVLTLHLEWMT